MSIQKALCVGWALFVFVTLFQAVVFAVWPDAAPAAAYIYGTAHGSIWLWVLMGVRS